MPASVLVTGASTGIGLSTTKVLLAGGFRVFAGVRSDARATSLGEELGERCHPLILDVTKPAQISAAVAIVGAELGAKEALAGLVNNAGIALPGPVVHQPIEALRDQFEVNVIGLVAVTQAFAPLLGVGTERGPAGRIVNVSSVAGEIAAPFLGAYSASKHAVEALSDALRRELMMYGVDVIIVGPGAVATPIWEKSRHADTERYRSTDYAASLLRFEKAMLKAGERGASPEEVAEVISTALTTSRPKARYAPVLKKLMNWTLPRLMSRRRLDAMIADRFHLREPGRPVD